MKESIFLPEPDYMVSVNEITIDYLVDLHSHLREMVEDIMCDLLENTRRGGVEIVGGMPNTKKGLRTAYDVQEYRIYVETCIRKGRPIRFVPYLMITEETMPEIIDECLKLGILDGKIYPYLRTTQSEYGVKHYARLIYIIRYCGTVGMRVHLHPEHPKLGFSHRDAEFAFLVIVYMFLEETEISRTEIWWEHGSTGKCIPHWKEMAKTGRFVVTLCAHHLASNEDDMRGDVSGVCNPSNKTEDDRLALCRLVEEDHDWVIGVSDSAFHNESAKYPEDGRCSCGAYTAPKLASIFAHALDPMLQKPVGVDIFTRFTSRNARKRCSFPQSQGTLKLVREPDQILTRYRVGNEQAVPFWGGRNLLWRIASN